MRLGGEIGAVVREFQVAGEFLGAAPFGGGHINDSYCATFQQDGTLRRFFLQRINARVFTDPAALMRNIERVTAHIASHVEDKPDAGRRVLRLIPTVEGETFHVDPAEGHWRMTTFIEGARAVEQLESRQQAFEIASAFGRFQQQLATLPPPRLDETIPNFHNTPKRFADLERAIEADAANRALSTAQEIGFALARKSITSTVMDAGLPERITHNDTKSSNVLLDDATGEGICVVDLDTVMPGCALYDFGDMVRSMTSAAAEDEQDLSRVSMRFEFFEELARGYLGSAGDILSADEKRFLAFAGKLITFENGLRFLSDYLCGDTYYKVQREGQNLDRCRTQFRLVESIEMQEERMGRMVETLS